MTEQCEMAPAIGRRSSRYEARQQCTGGVATPPRAKTAYSTPPTLCHSIFRDI